VFLFTVTERAESEVVALLRPKRVTRVERVNKVHHTCSSSYLQHPKSTKRGFEWYLACESSVVSTVARADDEGRVSENLPAMPIDSTELAFQHAGLRPEVLDL